MLTFLVDELTLRRRVTASRIDVCIHGFPLVPGYAQDPQAVQGDGFIASSIAVRSVGTCSQAAVFQFMRAQKPAVFSFMSCYCRARVSPAFTSYRLSKRLTTLEECVYTSKHVACYDSLSPAYCSKVDRVRQSRVQSYVVHIKSGRHMKKNTWLTT